MLTKVFRVLRLLPFALAIAGGVVMVMAGCGKDEVLRPGVTLYDRTVQSIAGPGGAKLMPTEIKGSYGPNCQLHAGETWSLGLSGSTTNQLEVVLNDTLANCPLTIASINVLVKGDFETFAMDYPVIPPIQLGTGYATDPSAVNQPDPPILAFYTNAKIERLGTGVYTNNFTIDVLYSDQLLACKEKAPDAMWATVTAVAVGTSVPAPSYTVDLGALRLVADARKIVQDSSTGDVLFTAGEQTAEEWRVYDGTTPCCTTYSFAEIDTIWKVYTPIGRGEVTGTEDIVMPWQSFELLGKTLPQGRTVILKHTDETGGVYSYELVQILFPGPA